MLNGELVSKSGKLYEVGKWGSPDHGGRPFYRFAIKASNENRDPFDEIYEMPQNFTINIWSVSLTVNFNAYPMALPIWWK